jgi:hypothetical protein
MWLLLDGDRKEIVMHSLARVSGVVFVCTELAAYVSCRFKELNDFLCTVIQLFESNQQWAVRCHGLFPPANFSPLLLQRTCFLLTSLVRTLCKQLEVLLYTTYVRTWWANVRTSIHHKPRFHMYHEQYTPSADEPKKHEKVVLEEPSPLRCRINLIDPDGNESIGFHSHQGTETCSNYWYKLPMRSSLKWARAPMRLKNITILAGKRPEIQ